MDDESERFMLQLDDPCDHITDTTGWTRYERHKKNDPEPERYYEWMLWKMRQVEALSDSDKKNSK